MSFLPGFVVTNWRLKLAAFGLAVFLWAAVRAEPDRANARTVSSVPVLVELDDLDWTLVGQPQPAAVDVRVGGSFGVFGSVEGELVVRVPIESVSATDTVVELRRDWVENSGTSSFRIEDISPPRIRLSFEETAEAAAPVTLRTTGALPDDLALAQPLSVNPAVVRVRGRASRVSQVDSVPLGPLDLSTLTESGTYRVAVDTTGFGDLTWRTVEAAVEVRLEEAVEQVFSGVPVVLDTVPEGMDSAAVATRPATLQVTLRGGRTRVAQVDAQALAVVVPSRVVRALRRGEQRVVPVRIRGVPDLVRAFTSVDSVRIVRLDGEEPPDSLGEDATEADAQAADTTAGGGAGGPAEPGGRR